MQPSASSLAEQLSKHPQVKELVNEATGGADAKSLVAQFCNADGERVGPPVDLPVDLTQKQMQDVLNKLQENEEEVQRQTAMSVREMEGILKTSGSQDAV